MEVDNRFIDLAAIVIAIFSLIISIYVIIRERKHKKLELILNLRDRILNEFGKHETVTADQAMTYAEEDPDSHDAQLYKAQSQEVQLRVEREIDFACYLANKGEIDFRLFFEIFKSWIKARYIFWEQHQAWKKNNYPNTWKLIEKCLRKGLLDKRLLTK